jgi:hypothetical protein
MRSWGNRPDTFVCDEPLYAHYLAITKRDHPGAAEVIAHHETDPARVITWLTATVPDDKPVFFQKHMAHHLLDDIDRAWLDKVTNCFLIRDPREMLTSLVKNVPEPTLQDTGLPQQVEIFERVRTGTDRVPPVLDARDVLEDPQRLLGLLCDAIGVEFTDDMLSWPQGRRDTDGIWAKHWYDAVEASTGFNPYRPKPEPVPPQLADLHEQCVCYYKTLHAHRLGQ